MSSEHDYVAVGDRIAVLQPTPRLRWHQPDGAANPQLEQWFEGRSTQGDTTYCRGEWRVIPTEP